MTEFGWTISRFALTSSLVFGAMSAETLAGNLSRYRNFQLGSDLPTVAKQAGADPSQATVIHSGPALIQELVWRPRLFRPSSQTEPVKQVAFSFYDGELFRVTIDYDRYQTAGLTAGDLVETISASYGIAAKPTSPVDVAPAFYGEQREVLAEWRDGFRLVGVLKRLEALFSSCHRRSGPASMKKKRPNGENHA